MQGAMQGICLDEVRCKNINIQINNNDYMIISIFNPTVLDKIKST